MQFYCLSCGMRVLLDNPTYRSFRGDVKCVSCGSILKLETDTYGGSSPRLISLTLKDKIKLSLPDAAPNDVTEDFNEAVRCFNSQAYKAAVTMCRRSLETACDSRKAKGKSLSEKITALHESGIIDEPTYNLASGIRQFGNYGAHPKEDLLKTVGEQEAELILKITERVYGQLWPTGDKTK